MHSHESSNDLQVVTTDTQTQQPLRQSVEHALQSYFAVLGDEFITDLYNMVLLEVEIPLLQAVMQRTSGNQSKAAAMLGINRGTLRKKLKQYNLE